MGDSSDITDSSERKDETDATTKTAVSSGASSGSSSALPQDNVRAMIRACSTMNLTLIDDLLTEDALYARQQCLETGQSPLMAAAGAGNLTLTQRLLELGAPWNAVDRRGQCAGNYATDAQHWNVVQALVDWAVRAELILGQLQRNAGVKDETTAASRERGMETDQASSEAVPPELESSTKPDYLKQRLQYTANSRGEMLLDEDKDAVMMQWEKPIMQTHAQILLGNLDDQQPSTGRSVLNIGFGMGIIDTALQELGPPSLHLICEAHPDVYQRMLDDKWNERPNVRILFGKWQDVLPDLIVEGVQVDAIFFDTYGEHFLDLEDFHRDALPHLLRKSNDAVYSFFNGLAPDNLFFHGVACECVKLQLAQIGLDSEFLQCEISVQNEKEESSDDMWEGVRRPYWHGRNEYYLPRCTWNPEFLQRQENGTSTAVLPTIDEEGAGRKKKLVATSDGVDELAENGEDDTNDMKRQCTDR